MIRCKFIHILAIFSGLQAIIGLTNTCRSQNLQYAHYLIDTLASQDFAGRGYVNNGCTKAADFIRYQFDSLGLMHFSKAYAQDFSFPVNTFPGKMEVKIDGKRLLPGDDYIVHPFSAAARGIYRLEDLMHYSSSAVFNNNKDVCYQVMADSLNETERKMLMDDLLSGKIKYGALIFLKSAKLTWSVATGKYRIPVVSVLQYYVPDQAMFVEIDIQQKFVGNFKAKNLIGYIKGFANPDSFIVFSAHYDHLGMMGSEAVFPGANDNASGVAMMLNLAQHFSKKENQPAYSLAFIAFAGEEAGLIGSKYYTENPFFELSKIKFLVNMDLLGTGDEGMMVVNATEYTKPFRLLDSINTANGYLPKISQRGKAKNSDHYWFSEKGVPSFFFYTMGGIQAYHDINDKASTLPLTEYEDVFRLIISFTKVL